MVTARVLRWSGLKEEVVELMAAVGFPCWIRGVGCVQWWCGDAFGAVSLDHGVVRHG